MVRGPRFLLAVPRWVGSGAGSGSAKLFGSLCPLSYRLGTTPLALNPRRGAGWSWRWQTGATCLYVYAMSWLRSTKQARKDTQGPPQGVDRLRIQGRQSWSLSDLVRRPALFPAADQAVGLSHGLVELGVVDAVEVSLARHVGPGSWTTCAAIRVAKKPLMNSRRFMPTCYPGGAAGGPPSSSAGQHAEWLS